MHGLCGDAPVRPAQRLATPRVAYVVAAVTVVLLVGTVPLSKMAKLSSGVGAGFLLVLVGFLVVGLILVRQRPRNPIGWVDADRGAPRRRDSGRRPVRGRRLPPSRPSAAAAGRGVPPAGLGADDRPVRARRSCSSRTVCCRRAAGAGRWATVAAVGTVWMIGAFAIAAEAIVAEPGGDRAERRPHADRPPDERLGVVERPADRLVRPAVRASAWSGSSVACRPTARRPASGASS